MKERSKAFENAIRRAEAGFAGADSYHPYTLAYVGKDIHQFQYPLLDSSEGPAAALFMKAVCQILGPESMVSVARVIIAPTRFIGESQSPGENDQSQEALMVIRHSRDLSAELYVGKVVRNDAGGVASFEEIRGLDPDDLLGRVANPYLLPEEGLPDWLIRKVEGLMEGVSPPSPPPFECGRQVLH